MRKILLFLRYLNLNWYRSLLSINNRILFIDSQCVNKKSEDFACQYKRLFPTHLPWQRSMNVIKVLWCRFQQCLGAFTMLLVEGSSQRALFRHLSDYVFRAHNIGSTKAMAVIFLFKRFKIWSRFCKCCLKLRKTFFLR